jgi:4'-phosphopantetheinyl transferase
VHWLDVIYYSSEKHGYPENREYLLSLLDKNELERYDRFVFEHLKLTFATARWILKTKLAAKLDLDPASIHLNYTDNGKPYIDPIFELEFSISHTSSGIAVAISNSEVGLDLEQHQRRGDPWKNAESFLNASIAKKMDSLRSDEEKIKTFSRYWTAMEAFVKYKGSTLFQEKDKFGNSLSLFEDGIYHHDELCWQTKDIDETEQISICTQAEPDVTSYWCFDGITFVQSTFIE